MQRIVMIKHLVMSALMLMSSWAVASSCTSAIVDRRVARDGYAMLWKHRDTGNENNFVARVNAKTADDFDYVALFNAGDSLLAEAWAGVNSAGFAIMNTASYNLVPDTASFRDREGVVMTDALRSCRTLSDFEMLLDSLPKPLGVQANFGVLDASGEGAYYETHDGGYVKYSLSEAASGVLYRTNYSYSGDSVSGFGYIRECNARYLLEPYRYKGAIAPETFIEVLSRSFYHSLLGCDMEESGQEWIVDQDFIPRNSSSASVVIEQRGDGCAVMWTVIGYPPCSYVLPVTVYSVPSELRPDDVTGRSSLCDEVVRRKNEVFPIKRGSGNRYINLSRLRYYNDSCRAVSMARYENFRRSVSAER